MKNKEKFASEILEFACSFNGFAVDKKTSKIVECVKLECEKCIFNSDGKGCTDAKKKWFEEEYKEPITAKRLNKEYTKMCLNAHCRNCEYSGIVGCQFAWLLDHYNVTEKEEKK